MGARSFELELVSDESQLLASGMVSVDSEEFPLAKRVPYATLRKPPVPPQLTKSAPYTLTSSDNGAMIAVTSATTISAPIAAALGSGFICRIYADGVLVTINRSGGGSLNLVAGDLATVATANNKVIASKAPATIL
jgi:hypothetical protein